MSTTNIDTESPPQVKQTKSDCGESSSRMLAPADAPIPEILTHIHRLNYDCFEQIFKWLSLKDLLYIRLTCKQLNEHSVIYIRAKYPEFTLGYGNATIFNGLQLKKLKHREPHFAKSIKKITFSGFELSKKHIKRSKSMLRQIEVLELENAKTNDEFYKTFFRFFPNVKHLIIKGITSNSIIGTDNSWLQQKYPNLDSVCFHNAEIFRRNDGESVKELAQFFQLNPNVHTFSTTYHYFNKNWMWLLDGKASIDLLKIKLPLDFCLVRSPFCNALMKLHAKGVYKRLYLYGYTHKNEADLDRIGLIPAIETLYFDGAHTDIDIPFRMTDLKELRFSFGGNIKYLDLSSSSLMNVERVFIEFTQIIYILPIIRHLVNVKVLYVDHLWRGTYFENGIVNVVALNEERAQLEGACKLTIYVKENIYLAAKWTLLPTKCSLIELGRAECYKFGNQKFGWKYNN